MSVEIIKGYADYPVKVVVREGNKQYVITTQTIRFDQYDHGSAFLKVTEEPLKPCECGHDFSEHDEYGCLHANCRYGLCPLIPEEDRRELGHKRGEAFWHIGQARTDGINPYGTCMTCGHSGKLNKRGQLRRHKGVSLYD